MSDLAASPGSPPEATSPRLSIFLSHSMADREHVAVVQRQIEALGVDVYLAEHDPHPGTSIADRVESALLRSHAVVVLISNNSVDSAYVQQEVGLARAHRKPIVPIVDKRVDKARLGLLTEVEWLEIDLDQPAEALARVTQSIQPMVQRQLRSNIESGPARRDVNEVLITVDLDAVVLIGIGLLLGLLIASVAFGGQGGAA